MKIKAFPAPSGQFFHLTYEELMSKRQTLCAAPDHNWRVKEELDDVEAHLAALELEMLVAQESLDFMQQMEESHAA